MNQKKIDILSKDQTRKMTPYAREEQKGEERSKQRLTTTEKHDLLKSLWLYFKFDRSFVFRLTGSLHTAIFADTIEAPFLRITPGHNANKGEKDTLFKDREPPKTIPYPKARTYIAHIGEYRPPPLPGP